MAELKLTLKNLQKTGFQKVEQNESISSIGYKFLPKIQFDCINSSEKTKILALFWKSEE